MTAYSGTLEIFGGYCEARFAVAVELGELPPEAGYIAYVATKPEAASAPAATQG